MIGIYKIENLVNNKVYIGQSTNIEKRWADHRRRFSHQNDCYDYPLYRAIRKYGLENFSFTTLEECPSEELNKKEQDYILKYNSFAPNGYNQTYGGQSGTCQTISMEDAEKIRLLLKTTILSQAEIAQQFSISQVAISDINIGDTWLSAHYDYPIRKDSILKQEYQCIDCGKLISNNATRCVECYHKLLRTVERPSRESLKQLIRTTPFVQIGKLYGVTDNAIRKWCKHYNLPFKASLIKQYSSEEWNNI